MRQLDVAIDWTAVGSIAAGIGVIVAIAIGVLESRRARFAKSIDLLLSFEARFESAEFRRIRARAAAFLVAGSPEDDMEGRHAVIDLLNFFETIAFLWRHGVASPAMIWHSFATWLLPYAAAAAQFVASRQRSDPNVFKEFERLSEELTRLEEKETSFKSLDGLIGVAALRDFLAAERSFPSHLLPPT